MSDDFENIGLGKQKLEENDIDGAMHHLFKVLKDNKDHIELYLINFDLFCRIQISTKNTPGGNIASRDVYLRTTSLRNAHADRNPNRNCRR